MRDLICVLAFLWSASLDRWIDSSISPLYKATTSFSTSFPYSFLLRQHPSPPLPTSLALEDRRRPRARRRVPRRVVSVTGSRSSVSRSFITPDNPGLSNTCRLAGPTFTDPLIPYRPSISPPPHPSLPRSACLLLFLPPLSKSPTLSSSLFLPLLLPSHPLHSSPPSTSYLSTPLHSSPLLPQTALTRSPLTFSRQVN